MKESEEKLFNNIIDIRPATVQSFNFSRCCVDFSFSFFFPSQVKEGLQKKTQRKVLNLLRQGIKTIAILNPQIPEMQAILICIK